MKILLFILVSLISTQLSAQSRAQLLEDIRYWSDSIKEETYNTRSENRTLLQVQQLIEEAHGLLSGARNTSQLICSRVSFGFVPTNTATGLTYGEPSSSIEDCQRLLPARGTRALCAKARFGFQHLTIDRAMVIGQDTFNDVEECMQTVPRIGQKIMCTKVRFGYHPFNLMNFLYMGDKVSTVDECLTMMPRRGSDLMCIKQGFGFQAINISTGRSYGTRTSTLEQCQRLIHQ